MAQVNNLINLISGIKTVNALEYAPQYYIFVTSREVGFPETANDIIFMAKTCDYAEVRKMFPSESYYIWWGDIYDDFETRCIDIHLS